MAASPHLLSEATISGQSSYGYREGWRRGARYHESIDAVLDHLGQATHIGADHRYADGARLEYAHWVVLVPTGGDQEGTRLSKPREHLFAADATEIFDITPPLARSNHLVLQLATSSCDYEPSQAGLVGAVNVENVAYALDIFESSGEEELWLGLEHRDWPRDLVRREEVGDYVDSVCFDTRFDGHPTREGAGCYMGVDLPIASSRSCRPCLDRCQQAAGA